MTSAARLFLYVMAAVLILVGLSGVTAPDLLGRQLKVAATAAAGYSEMRGLMGGGFIGLGVSLILGLRPSPRAPGLLLAMALMMLAIALGRVVSLVLDGPGPAAVGAAVGELLIAAACWHLAGASEPGYR